MDETGMVGWDFSRLDGRMWSDEPPWNFEVLCADALRDARDVLDLGTGGGERLIELLEALPQPWPKIAATEGWRPNIPVATENLAPLGIEVIAYDPETDAAMPVAAAAFDLIMNRHEALDAAEVARALRPGGLFLTQQVDGNELPELRELFGGEPSYPQVTLSVQQPLLEAAGLKVLRAEEWSGELAFADRSALDEYLTLVPWDRPDAFDPARLPEGCMTLTQRRFLLVATR